jgi:hypothetical protein
VRCLAPGAPRRPRSGAGPAGTGSAAHRARSRPTPGRLPRDHPPVRERPRAAPHPQPRTPLCARTRRESRRSRPEACPEAAPDPRADCTRWDSSRSKMSHSAHSARNHRAASSSRGVQRPPPRQRLPRRGRCRGCLDVERGPGDGCKPRSTPLHVGSVVGQRRGGRGKGRRLACRDLRLHSQVATLYLVFAATSASTWRAAASLR